MRKFQQLTLALILSMTLAPAETWAQDSTYSTSTTVTLTGSELAEVVDRACHEARAKAREADGLLIQRNKMMNAYNQCVGALGQYGPMDAQRIDLVRQLARVEVDRDSRFGWWWMVGAIVGGLAIGWGVGQF